MRSVIDLGDVTLYFATQSRRPKAVEHLARGAWRSRSATAALSKSRAPGSAIRIIANEKIEFSNFNFSVNGGTLAPPGASALMINGVPVRFADVGALVISAPFVSLRQPGRRAFRFSLVSFDINEFDAPLPAAGLFMLAGLVGIGVANLANRRRKPN